MRLFSIAPHEPFLPVLARAILDGRLLGGWDRTGPFWLSDVTVVVPTQRARQALAEAFAAAPGFAGLLPDIRTFGGEEADEEPFLPPFDTAPMAPAASGLQRRLVLSHLVAGWARSGDGQQAFSTPPTAAEIFAMSDALGTLIDDLIIEERSAADVRAVGETLGPGLGAYWQQTLAFLDIALTAWPGWLAEHNRADIAQRRRARLDRQTETAPFLYGERPVIAAGSTGSIPATARLLTAIARLPRGAVVLPGLDTGLDADAHAALLNADANPHSHPQYGLARLLRQMGAGPGQVVELAATEHKRTQLVHRALALAAATANWAEQRLEGPDLDSALAGVTLIAARTEDEEARAIALAAREALAEGRSVGIVTPDRNLARRIAADLKRFDISVDDAAGAPLFHSPAGRLARQVLALAVGGYAAVDLVALLRHRGFLLGRSRGEITSLADDIELKLLRGQRPGPGLAGLRRALAARLDEDETQRRKPIAPQRGVEIGLFFDALETALLPLERVVAAASIDAGAFAAALLGAVTAIAGDAPVHGQAELEAWANALATLEDRGHRFAPVALDAVLAQLMAGVTVRNRIDRRSDIAIWGQLEARLMSPDLLILCALNEDKWPGPADPGPWLSRGMRLVAGLEPPERMQGLAAHDFAQGMGNAEVILAYADRIGASPALPSRLVQRLDAFVGEAAAEDLRRRGRHWIDLARRIDAVTTVVPASRPAPNPPVAERPRRLSVTEIETLMRSPYDLYAKHVLRLRPLDPLGEDPDARERGTIIHAIFARFVREGIDPAAPDAEARLMAIAADAFSGLDAIGERRDIWLARFATAAAQFLAFEAERAPRVRRRHAEIGGRLDLHLPEPFRITGQADRVDEMADGTLEILDFKTGAPLPPPP